MVGSIVSSPAVDLSALPPPVLVPQPDYEARLAAKLAGLIAAKPEFSALVESDPAMKLLEADSYDETVMAQAFDFAARSLLLAYATGANLDQIGALMDVPRQVVTPATDSIPAVMESDTIYKRRIQLAPHSFSVAGPQMAYIYHTLSAHADVADATAVSPSPGEILVTVLSASGDGVPAPEVLAAVDALLQGDVRPLTDHVTVQAPELVDFAVEAELYVFAGPDQTLILQTAQAALAKHLASVRKLGRDISRSGVIAALHVGNVQRVNLIQPAEDIAVDDGQVGRPTGTSVTIAGTEL